MKCVVIGCQKDPEPGSMYCKKHREEDNGSRELMTKYRDGRPYE